MYNSLFFFVYLQSYLIIMITELRAQHEMTEGTSMSKREYIQTNKDWLLAKSKEEGVKALPKGIYYKVLAEGNASSAQPTVRSIITVHALRWLRERAT